MNEDKEKNGSCCSDQSCSSNPKPTFKKELTLLTTTADTTCQDECCNEQPKEPTFKKSLNLIHVSTAPKCEDACCQDEPSREESHENLSDAPGHKSEFIVYGMDCSACAVTIEKAVRKTEGVSHAQVNYSTGKMQVIAAETSALDTLPETVKKLGYTLEKVEQKGKGRTYNIEGMDCGSCALTIENHFKNHAAVKNVSVNFSTGKMTIEHDNSVEEIIKEVSKAGYKASLVSSRRTGEVKKVKSGTNAVVLSGALLLFGFVGSYTSAPPTLLTILYALSIVIGGYKPAKSAFYAVKSRSLDMNVLMTAAVLGAAAIGQWFEGATVVWLFALGMALQTTSIEKTRNSIRSLIDLAPPEAFVKNGEALVRKPVEEVSVGDVIVVKPGDRIPLDGQVIGGESSVNQAPITGESIPVDKQSGDMVYAGTINEHGSLEIQVTKLVEDTTIAKIIHLVEEAQEQKAPTEAFVDKFARIYTPIVFVLALVVMVLPPLVGFGTWGEWFYKGLELLVVACPCALVISTPVAIVSAIGNAAKNGVLIKGGAFLEIAGRISAIAFDKTGTLTEGKPKVAQVIPYGSTQEELLAIAKTLEEYSTHPIAKAVVDYANEAGIAARQGDKFRNFVGKGVGAVIGDYEYLAGNLKLFQELNTDLVEMESRILSLQQEGHTIVIVGTKEKIIGVIAVADTVRDTSVKSLKALQGVGVNQVVMLTGDNEGTAKKVASQTGVNRYFAELLPEDKVIAIKQLQEEGYVVAMVGDGINDAPALATADLGIAMGGAGTDTAMETADIVLMADNLEKLPHTVKLSRKAIRIIKQNIWFSLIVKAAALILIFPDLLTLWIAVISDTGAALIVILNSMRLLRIRD
ncbi:cadmium-translocating P-type ATPase [Paenibacillus alginolyticus]|uniref:heavy metal translocating P-type ATPase n=1 Tax=Paenibacillus alginolyticus TaxID=59839 RepID=UPI000401913C|nr:heavy metal translocating P-type ATPase [Paenibacillus alginolyticus]MCY9667398.1 cadmium-translocating P-type ATPase [Paenibacillus alginolyticus]